MTIEDKIKQLRSVIDEKIISLIKSDYVLWGLPYYINPGDTLIWEGALNMLNKSPYKCLGTCGWNEYQFTPLSTDVTILIIGGGFFGDIWRHAWDMVMNTIIKYPDNPIVVLPQSIYYQNLNVATQDAERLSQLKNLTICARDQQSFDFAKQFFRNSVVLVPDLAFYCSTKKLNRFSIKQSNRILFLKRCDKELPDDIIDINGENVDCVDWPAMSGHYSLGMRVVSRLISLFRKLKKKKIVSLLYKYGNRNVVIRDAVRFISQYQEVYTTRLHVMILSFLLGKRVYIVDNSYGKVSNCYQTWLSDIDKISIQK